MDLRRPCKLYIWLVKIINNGNKNIPKDLNPLVGLGFCEPVLAFCKVAIPRGMGRSYGIRWRSEMRITAETKGDGRTDGRTEHIA